MPYGITLITEAVAQQSLNPNILGKATLLASAY